MVAFETKRPELTEASRKGSVCVCVLKKACCFFREIPGFITVTEGQRARTNLWKLLFEI